MLVRGPGANVTIELPPLPATGPIEWWHRTLGANSTDANRGSGIRVGVLDTGVGPHPHLAHVMNVGAFIDGTHDPSVPAGQDVDLHGSHVCGIIGARPPAGAAHAFEGVAPGVTLLSGRIFPAGMGANQGDIALGIDHLSRVQRADLINMSLGADEPSDIERDAILDALERGTLCICAAGNEGGAVSFPGAFAEAVAVSAIGLAGWGPPGTIAAGNVPAETDKFGDGNLFLASFSCFGEEIDCAAPGVGIISTIPALFGALDPNASLDGTSMASPAACAAIASSLARSAAYRSLPRDLSRASFAREHIWRSCRSIGLPQRYQGAGVPQV